MSKTAKEILDDHIALCILAYARLIVRHNEHDTTENRENGVMELAIQAASLFTVASMTALGNSEHTARVLDFTRDMFRDLEDIPSVGETCTVFFGFLENMLLHTGNIPKGGADYGESEPAPDTLSARTIQSR